MRTKLVTFDGRGTLFKLRNTVGYFYAKAAEIYNVKATAQADQLSDAFKHEWSALTGEHPNFGAATGVTSQKWWAMMVERVFRTAGFNDNLVSDRQLTAISAHLFKQFSTAECWEVTGNEVLTTLRDIRQKYPHLKLGVVSNTDPRLESILMQLGLRHYFHFAIDSFSVKCEKPDRRIFEAALDRAKLTKPEEAMHVGDNVQLDYVAARDAGLRSLLLDHGQDKTGVDAADVISSISDVRDHI